MAYYFGALAQLGERLICIQEVRSSILLGSTITNLSAKQYYCLAVQLGDFDIVKRDTNIAFFGVYVLVNFSLSEAQLCGQLVYNGLFLDRTLVCFVKQRKLSKSNTLTKHFSG